MHLTFNTTLSLRTQILSPRAYVVLERYNDIYVTNIRHAPRINQSILIYVPILLVWECCRKHDNMGIV